MDQVLKIGVWVFVAVLLFYLFDGWQSGKLAQQFADSPVIRQVQNAAPAAQAQQPQPVTMDQAPAGATPVPTAYPVEPGTGQDWYPRTDGTMTTQINGVWYCTPHPMDHMALVFFGHTLRNDLGHQAQYQCQGVQ